jgi:biotin-(acetyl-CoA carboxylase) ligase
MWWLSDDPGEMERRFGIRAPSSPGLRPGMEHLWGDLAGGAQPWMARDSGGDDGRVLVHVARAGSSRYDVLKDGLDRSLPLPRLLACVSGSGERFHGHRERAWAASAGNLHLSVLVRSGLHAGRTGLGLSMLPVVAVAEMLAGLLPADLRPGIKWVNDIVIGGRKVAGVLASSRIRGSTIEECLFGIGLNVAVAPEVEPTVFVPGTACLAEWMEKPPALGVLVVDLIDRIENLLEGLDDEGPGRLHGAYCRFAEGLGREVCVWTDEPGDPLAREPLAEGRLRAIRPDLALEIDGVPGPVTRGRLAFRDDCLRMKQNG